MKIPGTLAATIAAALLLGGCQSAGTVPAASAGTPGTPDPARAVSTMAEKASIAHRMALDAAGSVRSDAARPFVFQAEGFPRLWCDGSTAELGEAAVRALLMDPGQAPAVRRTGTEDAYRALMDGEADVILASDPAASIWDEKEARGFEWEMAPVAVDALAFVADPDAPVDGLTAEQIRGIFSGAIDDWQEVGGGPGTIAVSLPEEGSGRRTALEDLVMDGAPLGAGLMETADDPIGPHEGVGIGCALYRDVAGRTDLMILAVDGVRPTAASVRDGTYPFLGNWYVLTAAGRSADDPARALYTWSLGPDGQALAALTGFVPAVPADEGGAA